MTSQQLDEERIFHLARRLPDADAQAEYLDQVCAGDQALRERVEAFLKVHEQEQSFLKSIGDPPPTEAIGELNIASGQQIGRYKLLQKIGEGGFGVVFMAEQSRPVRRKVALKVIKPGMDTQAVVARFEAERQALAMMDHPNIARVFDGGATDGGRPYFVMELVKGVPITEYCDKNELSTEQRLKLFTTVCQAVQHAHQKGIIHRDLKPSNVLVTLADGQPVVKVIDFGVAKATNQQLTEKTLFTAFGQMVGTPQYMSPEQAEMSCLDVDTRSDVYSLGVLLYELLTGTTPLEAERLRTAGYAEMQRMIRDEEPPKPSTRLSTSGDKLTIIAKHRKVSPDKLKSQVKGDLDWIVMKALEKDRNRRYETAAGFANDIGRYLNDEPVEARPPTLRYRTSKYFRRNRIALTVVGTLLTSMALVLGNTFWSHKKIAEDAARTREILTNLQEEMQLRATRLAMSGRGEARDVVDELVQQDPNKQAWKPFIEGHLSFFDGNVEKAFGHFQRACELDEQFLAARVMLALTYLYRGFIESYLDELAKANKTSANGLVNELYAIQVNMYDRSKTQETINELEQFFKDNDYSPVARLVRAEVMAHKGLMGRDMNAIGLAIHDSSIAMEEIPDNPMAAFLNMNAHAVAVLLCREKGLANEIPEHIRAGNASGMQIEPLSWAAGHTYRALFHHICEPDSPKAALAWERAQRCGLRGFLMEEYLSFHLEKNTTPTVGRKLDFKSEPYAVLAECLLTASDPSSRADSVSLIHSQLDSTDGPVDFYVAAVLSLLGYDVTTYASRGFDFTYLRASIPRETRSMLNEYFCGRLNEAALEERCAEEGIEQLSFVQLCSGMKLMGEHESTRAMELVRKAASDKRDFWSSSRAAAILARLEESPNWPYSRVGMREPSGAPQVPK